MCQENKIKILLLGARGYLGSHLIVYKPDNVHLIASARDNNHISDIISNCSFTNSDFEFAAIDILNEALLVDEVKRLKPDIIINCAANSLPDVAEEKRDWTYSVNVTGVENIIEACRSIGAKLIHLSTDYVFSGKKGNYTEDDSCDPVNYYGKTKLEAERRIIDSDIDYWICRTSVLYGLKFSYQRRVLFYSVYNPLKEGKTINAAMQIGSPTLVDDLARALYEMINSEQKGVYSGSFRSGIYHMAGSEAVSRYDYANVLAEVFNFDRGLIKKAKTQKRLAARPQNSSLNVDKLKSDFNIVLTGIKGGLEFIKKRIVELGRDEL